MRVSWSRRSAYRRSATPSTATLLSVSALISSASALNFTKVTQPEIDFSELGRVGIAGDFTGISIYEYEGQSQGTFSTNGSEALLAQLPNGVFTELLQSDAVIRSMCKLPNSEKIMLGGDFTSLDGNKTQSLAVYTPSTSDLKTLTAVDGQINTLFCDDDGTVYIGGNFKTNESMNAITWSESGGFTNLQFAGFNGPVNAIAKTSNDHIIFGGSFTGLGNASLPTELDGQAINLSSANITSGSSTTTQTAYSDPSNIVCNANDSSTGWLLEDDTAGYWEATLGFTFRPTKLRLWNSKVDDRGTKTWRFTALPLNGILNMTYLDSSGQNVSCTNECPLSNNDTATYQDFHFVNVISMSSFRIDISAWYGSGGGFSGIELFQDDITSYAINDFNEPSCLISSSTASKSTTTGTWTNVTSSQTDSEYISASVSSASDASVTFYPDIRQTGNYTVNVYTPGCIQDNSCSSRGRVNITGSMTSGDGVTFTQTLFQTNNYDKYEQIYFGYVDSSDDSFRPSITLAPIDGISSSQTIVAQRVGFILINSTGGLNGLYDFDPSASSTSLDDFDSSAVNQLGSSFDHGSAVFDLAVKEDTLFVAGNFSSSNVSNIAALDVSASTASDVQGGVNGKVVAMHMEGSQLYVGGSFNDTDEGEVAGMSNIGMFDTSTNSWSAIGAGVNGPVEYVVAMDINLVNGSTERVISFTGSFNSCYAFDTYLATDVSGLAVWVPSQNNWVQNLNGYPRYDGIISASVDNVTDVGSLVAGSVISSSMSASNAATLTDGVLGAFSVHIINGTGNATTTTSSNSTTPTNSDTASTTQTNGVSAGAFYSSDDRNLTILAGHFTAASPNGTSVQNLVIIDGSDGDSIRGLGSSVDSSSVFNAVSVNNDLLYAGGDISGQNGDDIIAGFVAYNLSSNSLLSSQPPQLMGSTKTVRAIQPRPSTNEIYVAGDFESAGALPCPAVCVWNQDSGQWSAPGSIKGTAEAILWNSDNTVLVGGSLQINDTTNTSLALYNVKSASWDTYQGASLNGAVTLLAAGSNDRSKVWVGGYSAGSFFLMKYAGGDDGWLSASPDDILTGSNVTSLQVFTVKKDHDHTGYLDDDEVLVLTGAIKLKNYGSVSAVVFDGTSFTPYLLTANTKSTGGSITRIFVEKDNFFDSDGDHMRLVFVVLIGLACSLGIVLLIVAAGVLLDHARKKREGYIPAPSNMFDRGSGLQRVPPQQLLEFLERGGSTAPRV